METKDKKQLLKNAIDLLSIIESIESTADLEVNKNAQSRIKMLNRSIDEVLKSALNNGLSSENDISLTDHDNQMLKDQLKKFNDCISNSSENELNNNLGRLAHETDVILGILKRN
jgi:hypothetical protein